jgi:valyl-tRNA synthetase
LEAVKDRLYRPEIYGEEKKKAAQQTLYSVLNRILLLLAPITPHVTEEIYQTLYGEEEKHASIHRSRWPAVSKEQVDEQAEKHGDLIMAVITEVRREKAEKHLPLNAAIKKLAIYSEDEDMVRQVREGKEDICGTCKIDELLVSLGKGKGREVRPYNISFTANY